MQSEFMERKCDYENCPTPDFRVEKNRPLSDSEAKEFARWVTLVWEVPLPNGAGLKPVVKHCCRTQCAQNLLKTFDPEAELRMEFEKAKEAMEAQMSAKNADKPILVGQA